MKTSVKILLLLLFIAGAVAGVLIYAKTRVAPPFDVDKVDQYDIYLDVSTSNFKSSNDFSQVYIEYLRRDNMLNQMLAQEVIDGPTADHFRQKIDATYGNSLIQYGFDLYKKPEWNDDQLKDLFSKINALKADKLTSGYRAPSEQFYSSAENLEKIDRDYRDAKRLTKSTFISIEDALQKLDRAKKYRQDSHLSCNKSLMDGLDALPKRLADSHYNYVERQINRLNNYADFPSKQAYYDEVQKVNVIMEEFRNTRIYGNSKKDMSPLDKKAIKYVQDGGTYFELHKSSSPFYY